MSEYFDLEAILEIEKELLHPNHINGIDIWDYYDISKYNVLISQPRISSILIVTSHSSTVYTMQTRDSTYFTKRSMVTSVIVTRTEKLKES